MLIDVNLFPFYVFSFVGREYFAASTTARGSVGPSSGTVIATFVLGMMFGTPESFASLFANAMHY